MHPDSWSRARSLFESALELPPDQRVRFVEGYDGEDEQVRREALLLLAHEQSAEGFLQTPAASAVQGERLWQPSSGDTIGGYRLEESLGAGGMGMVFAARQERPSRMVALKVMHASALSGDARKRFEFEAEILGRLRHPGIAVIHELGVHTSPEGNEVPYFAMEYVEGARDLITHADEEQLSVRARVERLREVCAAVEAAHQKGVIHRDLKPANVLVDEGGRTKVIDYGVARVIEVGPASGPETMTGYVLGTFGHMAPEQLSAGSADVDTRADVYALGVLLYQLLTGRLPHETRDRPIAETIAQIVSRPPAPPSSHAPELPSELDWVALKALEIDRDRRYPSPSALADDLERFLRQLPVLAGPPTRRYRFGKFVVRNRWTVVASALAVVALVAGTVVSTLAMLRADERRIEAETARAREATQAAAALRSLRRQEAVVASLSGIFAAVRPDEDGREVTLFELLERKRPTLETAFADEPELRGSLQVFLATAYDALGLHETGDQLLESAADALRSAPEHEAGQLAWIEVLLAKVRTDQGRYEEAEELLARALPVVRGNEGVAPDARVEAERIQAWLLASSGYSLDAIEAYRRALGLGRELLGPDHPTTLQTGSLMASNLSLVGIQEEATQLARDSWQRAMSSTEEGHPLRLFTAVALADVLARRGVDEELVQLRRDIADECVVVHGEFHRNTIQAIEMWARALASSGSKVEAERQAWRAIELSREHHAESADRNMRAHLALADVLEIGGDLAGAVLELEEAIGILDEAGLAEHGAFTELSWRLARGDLDGERPEDAEWRLRELFERLQATPGNQVGKLVITRAFLGLALSAQGRGDEARVELGAACDGVQRYWDERELAALTGFVFDALVEACDTLGHEGASALLEAAPRD